MAGAEGEAVAGAWGSFSPRVASTELPMEAFHSSALLLPMGFYTFPTLPHCFHCASKCQPTKAATVCTIPRYFLLYVQIPCILLGVNEPWCRKGEVLWCRTNAPKCVPPFHELLLKSVLEAEIKWENHKKNARLKALE